MKETKPQHSPLPWTTQGNKGGIGIYMKEDVFGSNIGQVYGATEARTWEQAQANAALIVRAVNAHEALVEAAKVALMELEAIVRDGGLGGPSCGNKNMDSHQALLSAQGRAETRNLLKSAIAKAQGDA